MTLIDGLALSNLRQWKCEGDGGFINSEMLIGLGRNGGALNIVERNPQRPVDSDSGVIVIQGYDVEKWQVGRLSIKHQPYPSLTPYTTFPPVIYGERLQWQPMPVVMLFKPRVMLAFHE